MGQKKLKFNCAIFILVLMFLGVFSMRLYFSFQSQGFSDDNSYFVLRQAEHIQHYGVPDYQDELSYGGRTYGGEQEGDAARGTTVTAVIKHSAR